MQRQGQPGQHQDAEMDHDLAAQGARSLQQVGVAVAGQQRDLEERQAGVPDRRRAAEPRQQQLGDHRLDQEDQGRAKEHRQRVEQPSTQDPCGLRGRVGHRAPLRRITFDCRMDDLAPIRAPNEQS